MDKRLMLPAPSRAFGLLLAALAVPLSAHAQDAALPEARASLARLGVDMRHARLTITPSDKPSYRVRIRHGAITAQGSSAIALVHGVAQVLERQGALSVTWEGAAMPPAR
jgi:alpha-N-acetylglucosaminidase